MSGTSKTEEKVKKILSEDMNVEGEPDFVPGENGPVSQRMRGIIESNYSTPPDVRAQEEDTKNQGVNAADSTPGQKANAAVMDAEATLRMLDRVATPSGSNETRKRLFIK